MKLETKLMLLIGFLSAVAASVEVERIRHEKRD